MNKKELNMDKSDFINCNLLGEMVNHIDCKILEHGFCYFSDNWYHLNMTSSFNRLYFVLDGEGIVSNEKNQINLTPGFAYIIPLNTTNDYICKTEIEKFYVHFRMELFNYKDVFEITDTYLSGPFDVNKLKFLLKKADPSDWISNLAIKAYIIETIVNLSSPLVKLHPGKMEDALKYKDVFEYVKTNCSIQLDAKEIANKFNMSANTFQKNFKKDLGISLKEYIITEILKSAKDKILITDLQVREISYVLGFCDEFYFSRFFKKHTGLSPANYRKQNKFLSGAADSTEGVRPLGRKLEVDQGV